MEKNGSLLLKVYAMTLTALLTFSLFAFNKMHQSFDEITVKRINIVDENGQKRIVISNQERIPPPIIAGKEYKRAVKPAGIIFYNQQGNECGGIALSNNTQTGLSALAFDYQNADAIGLLSRDDYAGKNFMSAVTINDKDVSGKPASNTNRVLLQTDNGNAGLIIKDPQGRERINITVSSSGKPTIKILDAKGKIIKRFSE